MKVNITNCYCLFLTIMFIITLSLTMSRIELLHDRCDYLENKIYAIKQPLYLYIQREGSIMNSAPSEDMIVAYNHLIDYFSHLP